MADFELLHGLPHRTINAETKDGKESIFGVSTEIVGELFNNNYTKEIYEKFDSCVAYYIPEELFENGSDEEVIKYINDNIDNNFKY